MNEMLNIAATALLLLAGLAALIRYVAQDVFSGPFAGPRSAYDATDPRDAESVLGLRSLSRP